MAIQVIHTLAANTPPVAPGAPVLFLAGPTLREHDRANERSWRVDALRLLAECGYEGAAVVPEFEVVDKARVVDSGAVWVWEAEWLARATVVMFWVPRSMDKLPGLTTNVEFGMLLTSGKIVFGAPPDAVAVAYMRHQCAARTPSVPQAETLAATVHKALMMVAARPPFGTHPNVGGCCGGFLPGCSTDCTACAVCMAPR